MNDKTAALINETIKAVTSDPEGQLLIRVMVVTVYSAGLADGLKQANKMIEEVTHGK